MIQAQEPWSFVAIQFLLLGIMIIILCICSVFLDEREKRKDEKLREEKKARRRSYNQ